MNKINKTISFLVGGLIILGLSWLLISSLSSIGGNPTLPGDSLVSATPQRDLNNLKIEKEITPQQQQTVVTGSTQPVVSNKYTLKSLTNDVVEIGTERHSPPKPYLKLTKWDGEVSLKVTIPINTTDNPVENGNTLVYQGDKQSVEFLSRTPQQITEKDSYGNDHTFTINEDGGVEFNTILSEKPTSNSISFPLETQGLDFFYQPPLNEENKDPSLTCTPTTCIDKNNRVVTFRPEQVVGSYAVYYKDGKSGDFTKMGGKNYKTGQAFHIYRPKVSDSGGKTTWGDLDIDETSKTLTVTVDQEWLNNATYPVTIDPTFGYETAGGSSTSLYHAYVGSLFSGSAGSIGKITASIYDTSGNSNVAYRAAVLYLHSDLSKVAQSATRQGDGKYAQGWVDFTFNSESISAVDYILMLVENQGGGSTSTTIYYNSGAANQGHSATYGGSNTDPLILDGTLPTVTHTTNKYSIYATYSPHSLSESPGTMADDSAVGTLAWIDPDSAIASDDIYTFATTFGSFTAHYLKATNLGFSVPSGATINGIRVEIDAKFYPTVYENEIKIVRADGSIGSENKAAKTTPRSSGTEATYSFGGASDLWSETWPAADINNPNFGVAISYDTTSGCLTKNSFIATPTGYSSIKDLEAGDKVLSYNESTNKIEEDTVSGKIQYPKEKRDIYYIYTGWLSKRIEATADHKFYTNRGLIEAKDLTNKDTLIDQMLNYRKITKIEKIPKTEYVYDISVEKNHNYFVNNILVHNIGYPTVYIDQIRVIIYYSGGDAPETPAVNMGSVYLQNVNIN